MPLRSTLRRALSVGLVTAGALFLGSGQAAAVRTANTWPMYLGGPAHTSFSEASAITPVNAASLTVAWHWTPDPPLSGHPRNELFSSPAIVGGTVYVGSNSGEFYAIDLSAGTVKWQRDLGFVPQLTCQDRGTSASPTVLPDPRSGTLTVYEAGGNGYLYAMNATTGAVRWKSQIHVHSPHQNDWFDWSSPTVAHGHIYVGLTSQCDNPLTRGGLKEFSQATGKVLHVWHATPKGVGGGGVWSTVAVTGGSVFATTGTPPVHGKPPGTDAVSVVQLNATTLAREGGWAVPLAHPGADTDFGASPVPFRGMFKGRPAPMVGAMNKNGIFYAWRVGHISAGPVWKHRIDTPVTPSIPAAVYNGKRLWVAGNAAIVNGVHYKGSIRKFTPIGTLVWKRGLPASVLGTPQLNASGVLAVATYDSVKGIPTNSAADGCYLFNAKTGVLLGVIQHGPEFAQPTFVGGYLLLATRNNGLYAYHP
jgi:outer membrane protein assembly factor BamB